LRKLIGFPSAIRAEGKYPVNPARPVEFLPIQSGLILSKKLYSHTGKVFAPFSSSDLQSLKNILQKNIQ